MSPTTHESTTTQPSATTQMSTTRLVRQIVADVPGTRREFAFALLLSVLASFAGVALMGTAGWLISRAAEQPPVMYLTVATVLVRACGLARGGFRYVERLVSHDLALRLQGALRLRTYDALARTTLLGSRRGDLLSRVVSDVEAMMDLMVRVLLPFASAGVVVIATTTILGTMSPTIAAGVLVTAVAAGAVVPWLAQRASRSADAQVVPARGELAALVGEINDAAADLTAYGDRTRIAALHRVDERLRRAEERAAVVRGSAAAAQVIAAGLSVLWALSVGITAVEAGTLSRVELGVVVLAPLALHEVLGTLTQSAQTWTRVRSALERVGQILNAPARGRGDIEQQQTAAAASIEVREAAIGWGEEPLRTGVNLTVSPGEWVAVTGPSGCGKTTLAATILGAIEPLAGIAGCVGSVGYLAQDAHVFNTSVRENVLIGAPGATDDRMVTALELAGFPGGASNLDRIVGEDGAWLSGGEARRLAIARLLVAGHQCWILDEPTEHLDRHTAAALLADLRELTADAPVLVVTHDPEVMALADRIHRWQ